MTSGKRLLDLVESLIPVRSTGSEGITAKELARKLGKSASHIYEPLNKLRFQRKIVAVKEKRGVDPSVTVFFKPSKQQSKQAVSEVEPLTCVKCQRFTAIGRCVLLDLVASKSVLYLDERLRVRWKKEELNENTPACEYYDKRVKGNIKCKHIHDFFQRNLSYNPYSFHCPLERCRKRIDSLSKPLQVPKLGFSAIYCPSCGCPMVLAYSEQFSRVEVKFWDSRYDFLQRDYRKLTAKLLSSRPSAKNFGISVHKDLDHFLDLQNEIIFLGSASSSSNDDVRDLVAFPLKELNYITTNSWSDYYDLMKALHSEYEDQAGESRKLYWKLTIFPPRAGPESATPTELEIGGNELMIFSGYLNPSCLQSNLVTRETAVENAVIEASSDSKKVYQTAKKHINKMVSEHSTKTSLDYRQWQQIEGGCGSLMYEPFKVEAREHGFFTPSRANARMVRSEPFLSFGLYRARSDFHSAINGVNRIVTSILKEVAYNQIEFPWFGLRGWCHQNQPQGLFYDIIEQIKIIALVKIIHAIREGVLLPSHFMMQRGKRFDELYCIRSESEGDVVLRRIAQSVLQTKVSLECGSTSSILQIYKDQIQLFQKLLNELSLSSSQLLLTNTNSRERMAPWKMLQQTRDTSHFSREELVILQDFIKHFLDNEFSFRSLSVIGIN